MMDDLLKAMLSGEGSQAGGGQPEENPLADLLGGMLGGGATPGAGGSEDLLQGLLGGPQGAGGTGDLLGAVLGGGGAEAGSQASLAPIASAIAEKLGLPPEVAQAVVAFVVGRLLSGGGQTTAMPPSTPSGRRRKSKPPRPQNLDLGGLLNQARSGQSIEPSHVRASGIHEELARQTGLDADTAARSVEEVLNLLGGQPGQSPGSRAGG